MWLSNLSRTAKIIILVSEAGSKPELLVAMALLKKDNGVLICNGYKDEDYIETALHAERLGIKTVLVLDRFAELSMVIAVSKRLGIKPVLDFAQSLRHGEKGAGLNPGIEQVWLSIREIIKQWKFLKPKA